ncbi:hypothetical protein [Streptomyces sp. SM11]|uniref:hypothetical protein n=1 Tax=Streptomyces sp. SM11 TaxID=565557 RepID=UPI0011B0B03B|nr:hypothetical protein [Streptomyces sp. SM11]
MGLSTMVLRVEAGAWLVEEAAGGPAVQVSVDGLQGDIAEVGSDFAANQRREWVFEAAESLFSTQGCGGGRRRDGITASVGD